MEVTALSAFWFQGLLTLVALALSTNILVGQSRRWRPVFISSLLLAIIACEYYYLTIAMLKIPRDWAEKRGTQIQRLSCLYSAKGGKRRAEATSAFDINPCFCPFDAGCKNSTSGDWMDPSVCPTDGTALCWDANLNNVPLYIESGRDCEAAQGGSCTKEEPCTPCSLDAIEVFLRANISRVSRCQTCGVGNRGACNFVIDEGPYCWKEPDSLEVEPCSVCCTESNVLYVNNKCH